MPARDVRIGRSRTTEIVTPPAVPAQPAIKVVFVQPDGGKAQPTAVQQEQAKQAQTTPAQTNGNKTIVQSGNSGQITAQDNPPAQTQEAVNDGLKNIAEAIRSLNPSYAVAPVVGNGAMTGGSFYIRTSAVPVTYEPVTWLAMPPLALPAPIVLGSRYPSWLYTGTVRVDVPPAAQIKTVAATAASPESASVREVSALRDEVRRLREMIEEMNERLRR